jgi:hypothetical protein
MKMGPLSGTGMVNGIEMVDPQRFSPMVHPGGTGVVIFIVMGDLQ